MSEVEWTYSDRRGRLGKCVMEHRYDKEERVWNWVVTHKTHSVTISGSSKSTDYAEEQSIAAAKWLNAGMPAPMGE